VQIRSSPFPHSYLQFLGACFLLLDILIYASRAESLFRSVKIVKGNVLVYNRLAVVLDSKVSRLVVFMGGA
jgi:hypothetical protein